jgi:hypothetical protein
VAVYSFFALFALGLARMRLRFASEFFSPADLSHRIGIGVEIEQREWLAAT